MAASPTYVYILYPPRSAVLPKLDIRDEKAFGRPLHDL